MANKIVVWKKKWQMYLTKKINTKERQIAMKRLIFEKTDCKAKMDIRKIRL